MARRPTKSQLARFRSLIARLEPAMQRAFLASVAEIVSSADWREFNRALAVGNIERAILAVGIEPAAFLGLVQAQQAAFVAGATETMATLSISGLPGRQSAGIRFDMTNPRAEAAIRTASSSMVEQISEDTKEALRETILSGYQAGRGPRDIATDISGRVVGGRRQGGIVGLDGPRAHRLNMVSSGMETAEGVRGLVVERRDGSLALRYKVNRQTEKAILAAYKRGEAVPDAIRLRATDQFRNALLKARADTIAQLETSQAVMLGREEEWRQVTEKLGRSSDEVVKTWQHGAGGHDPRVHHEEMNGHSVVGLDTPFVFSNNARMKYAHDPSAPVGETANCTCDTTFRLPARKEDLL